MTREELYECYVANTAEELLSALSVKPNYILITKNYRKAFLEKSEVPMPEENFLRDRVWLQVILFFI